MPLLGQQKNLVDQKKSPQQKNIQQPKNPQVIFKNPITSFHYNVTISYANGAKEQGSIEVPFKVITVMYKQGKAIVKRTESMSALKSIQFLKWKIEKKKSNAYGFFPNNITVIFKDRTIIERHGNIKGFNKLTFYRKDKPKKFIYSFFYDYWINKMWQNSGKREADFPETNPHKDTVVSILFHQ